MIKFLLWWGTEFKVFQDIEKGHMKFWTVFSPVIRLLFYALGFLGAWTISSLFEWSPALTLKLSIVIPLYILGYYLDLTFDDNFIIESLWVVHALVAAILIVLFWM